MKRFVTFVLIFTLSVGLVVVRDETAQAQGAVYACDELYYGKNEVLYYNPCASTCNPAEAGVALTGIDNAEKIWNFYAAKGLTPIAVAGIMGNFSEESTFDPAVKQNQTDKALPLAGDGVTGYGLAQWTYQARQAMLFAKIKEAGLDQYLGAGWGPSEKNREMPQADIDKLLEVELTFSWEGDSTKIKDLAPALNAATSVEGNDGSTVIFHNTYENSSDNASQIQERVTAANAILAKFGSGNTAAGSDACASNLKVGGVKTIEDAVAWAQKYAQDTQKKYPEAKGVGITQGKNPILVYKFGHDDLGDKDTGCWQGADCGQCVALSGWFVLTQTTDAKYLNANGGYVVDEYEAAGLPTGTKPRPFSIFSAKSDAQGHTGVVLGVLENGDSITVEGNWNSNGTVAVWQGNLEARYKGKDLKFAYFDDRLANEAAAAASSTVGVGAN